MFFAGGLVIYYSRVDIPTSNHLWLEKKISSKWLEKQLWKNVLDTHEITNLNTLYDNH